MQADLIIRNANLVDGAPAQISDIAIHEGRILEVGKDLRLTATEEIDAANMTVIPGCIDTQVHFREPGMEHKEDISTGSKAAIAGGVTTYFEMPNTNPPTTTKERLEQKLKIAAETSYSDHAFFVGASPENIDQLSELETLPGCAGVKIFMGSSTGPLVLPDDDTIRRVLGSGSRPVAVHAEHEPRIQLRKKLFSTPQIKDHPRIRDTETARIATSRITMLCEETRRPVHVLHINALEELPLLIESKRKGLPVTCEVTPQHLFFCANDYDRLGTRIQQNPPIRAIEHRSALQAALAEGVFDVMGSDHAPHTLEEKNKQYPDTPSGMPGVQTFLQAALTIADEIGIPLHTIVALLTSAPAKLYGIQNKGSLKAGFDADLVILDPSASVEIKAEDMHSKCGWSPFEGQHLRGQIKSVYLRGVRMVEDGKVVGTPASKPVTFDG